MANELASTLKLLVHVFSSPLIVRVLDSFKRDKTLKKEHKVQIQILEIFISTVEAYRNALILNDKDISSRYATLKDIIQTGVDAIELYSKAIETGKIRTLENSVKNFCYTLTIHACKPHCSIAFLRRIERANNDIAKLLEKVNIIGELPMLNTLLENQQKLRPIATSVADPDYDMLGRDKIKDEIVRTLNNEYNKATSEILSVFAIVGMGGIGKTRLAQSVHETVTRGFDLKGWVDDNSKKFDVATLLEKILTRFNGGVSPNNSIPNELVNSLVETVRNKKFLLIIDDVWTTDQSCWEDLLIPLKTGKPGSWLIITTRDKAVVQSIDRCKKGTVAEELSRLNEETLWEIVKQHAFHKFDPRSYGNLEIIGRRIVGKLDGSPLAAKAIGRVLGSELSQSRWEEIEGSDLWNLQNGNNLVPALVLSFLHLPSHAKPCFTYCSLFPKGKLINKREVVYQWLAHDFIGLDDGKASVEDVGATVIDDMKNMHLCAERKVSKFEMHDLIHDMSRASGKDDHLQILDVESIEKTMLEGKSLLRHLCMRISEKFNMESLSELHKCKKLRTLIIMGGLWMRKDSCPRAWLKNLPCLRVLTLHSFNFKKVPEEIGKLKHLRYLDLSFNFIEQLPRFQLYHLQVLILRGCEIRESESIDFQPLTRLLYLDLSGNEFLTTLPNSMSVLSNLKVLLLDGCYILDRIPHWISKLRSLECLSLDSTGITKLPGDFASLSCLRELHLKAGRKLVALPSDFDKLVNLRHLHLNEDSEHLLSSVSGIGKLTLLESLNTFTVRYHKIDELADLNMLHGKLVINGLRRVQSRYEAQNAKLQQKIHLNELAYYYGNDDFMYSENRDVLIEEGVLECLEPCKQLTKFTLNGYLGRKLPSWLTTPNCPNGEAAFSFWSQQSSLSHLSIRDCPSLLSLNNSLRELCISSCDNLQHPPVNGFQHFESLEILEIQKCPKLTKLGADMTPSPFLPRLRKVNISNCKKLEKLPDMPLSLETMSLKDVGLGELPSFQCQLKVGDGAVPSSSSSQQSSLTYLEIHECPSLVSLNEGLLSSLRLPCLRELCISSCDNLQQPPVNGFQHFESLEILEIQNCPKLTKLGADMTPSPFLPRLRKVYISNCKKLEKLPDMPLSLEVMILVQVGLGKLPSLQCQRKMGDGEAASSSSLQQSSLSILSIFECPSLLSLNEGLLSSPRLPCLRELLIRSCDNLQHPPVNGFQHFESLEILEIRECPKLTEFCLNLPTSSTSVFLEVHIDGSISCACNMWLNMITDNKEVSFNWKCKRLHISISVKVPISILQSYEPALFDSTLADDLIIQVNHAGLDVFVLRGSHIQSLWGSFLSLPFSCVRELKIADCQNLAIAPDFTTLTRLESLTLDSCPKLKELSPEHTGAVFPASLCELVIRHCHVLPIESALKTALLSLQKIELLLENNSLCVSNSFVNTVLSGFLPDLENDYYFNVVTCNIQVRILAASVDIRFGENKMANGCMGCYQQGQQATTGAVTSCTNEDALVNLLTSKPSSRVTKLCIAGMHDLTVISRELAQRLLSLTSLKVLQIEECENLQSLPTNMSNLSSLESIVIKSCNNFSPQNEGWNSVKDGECFLGLPNICHLELHGCQRLSSLPTDRRLSASSALRTLVIESCDGIGDLSSLDNLLPFLHRLRIAGCKNLERPPRTGFTRFASLETLELIDCPKLASLPLENDCHLPVSLRDLTIISCGDLLTTKYLESYLRPLTSLQKLVIRNQVGRVPYSFVGWLMDLQNLRECDVFFKPPAFKIKWTSGSWMTREAKISWGYEPDEIERREETRPRVETDGWTREKLLIKMLKRIMHLGISKLYIGGVHEITTTGGKFDELFGTHDPFKTVTIINCGNDFSEIAESFTEPAPHDTLQPPVAESAPQFTSRSCSPFSLP